MKIDISEFLNALQARECGNGFYDNIASFMGELSNKIGIDNLKVHIPLLEHPTGNVLLDAFSHMPNAGALGSHDVIISQPLLDIFGQTGDAPLCDEVKAILAHEANHMANFSRDMLFSRAPVFLMPVIAVTAMYLYDKAKEHSKESDNKKEDGKQLISQIDKETELLQKDLKSRNIIIDENQISTHSEENKNQTNGLLTAAKYIAVTAAGIAAGLMVARYGARYIEFEADKFAAETVGKDAMINALEQLHNRIEEIVSEQAELFGIAEKPEINIFMKLLSETIGAHPSLAERVQAIRNL